MDEMTDFQFVKLLQMVLEILKASKTLEGKEIDNKEMTEVSRIDNHGYNYND